MSMIAIALNLIVSLLLVCALAYGMRLERRLKTIREGQAAFGQAVAELNRATEQARAGLAELRATTDESTDLLGGRIARAREAAERLERALSRAETAAASPPAPALAPAAPRFETPGPAMGPEGGLSALLARLQASEARPAAPSPVRPAEAAPARAFRPAVDDDLFDDAGAFA